MWIRTQDGMVNTDKFTKICHDTSLCRDRIHVAVVGIQGDVDSENVIAFNNRTLIEIFESITAAQKFIDKIAAKLGAINYDDV